MSENLLAHLSSEQAQRATRLPLFADASRLARKPRCSGQKGFSQVRSAPHALRHRYIQPNSPMAFARVVFDLDWHHPDHPNANLPLRYLTSAHAWTNDLGLPPPNWAALSPGTNSAHIGYELTTPVARHEHARRGPLSYLAAIEACFAKRLKADRGFNGALCKNPVHPDWELHVGRSTAYDMSELAEWVDLKKESERAPPTANCEVGRNVYLFDTLRQWAYKSVNEFRERGFERWQAWVVKTAHTINDGGYDNLPDAKRNEGLLPHSEVNGVGRSVARWTWEKFGSPSAARRFSERQATRGALGAAAASKLKRERMEQQISAAIQSITLGGGAATAAAVARLINCSPSTLSKHYRLLFQRT
jgi:hypothetical protein